MRKHSPGPWAFEGNNLWDSDGKIILICTEQEDGEEGEANARLIAAAPEMLEALKRLAHYEHDTLICERCEAGTCEQGFALAAIAKAEGK